MIAPRSKPRARITAQCDRITAPILQVMTFPQRIVVILASLILFMSLHALSIDYVRHHHLISAQPFPQPGDDDVRRLLTIVVDRQRGDEQCVAFVHKLLPSWVRWRYVRMDDDNLDALQVKSPTLIVTRWVDTGSPILDWARRHPHAVGLMLMADETNTQNAAVYASFDYVLRHYYFRHLSSHPHMPIRALGNLTCGSGPAFPPTPGQTPDEPRLGVHWMMLQGRGLGNLDSGHASGSYWPASQRRRPAMWIGSIRADRSEMVDVMQREFPDADIQVEYEFGGRTGPFEYGQLRAADAVFALVPFGNNPETHRLAEVMDQGSIPVFLEAEFQYAPYQPVPGVSAKSWVDAAAQMKNLLQDAARLDRLQAEVVNWWHRMQSCMTGDLDLIIRAAVASR